MKELKKKSAPAKTAVGLDLSQAEQVLAFMTANHLEEFEFSQGELHIRMKKAAGRNSSSVASQDSAEAGYSGPAPSASDTAAAPPARSAGPKEELHIIKSPIVGTF